MQPKKILIAFDGSFYAVNALDFALAISSTESDLFTGVFIQDLSYPYMGTNFGIEPQPFEYSYEIMNQMMDEDTKEIDNNISRFTSRCKEVGVQFRVHFDKGIAADEIIRESAYADVIVTGHKTYFSSFGEDNTGGLVNEVLANAHCPIWVIPESFTNVNEVIFAYDGLESSAWAIKQFTYLYAEQMRDKKFTILSVKDNEEEEIENEKLILEYVKLHYPEIRFVKQVGKIEDEITYYVKTAPDAILVLGMQNKNFFSRIFNPGHAKNFLQNANLPVFIAHK